MTVPAVLKLFAPVALFAFAMSWLHGPLAWAACLAAGLFFGRNLRRFHDGRLR